MSTILELAGFGVVLLSAVLLLVLSILYRKKSPTFREIPAFTRKWPFF